MDSIENKIKKIILKKYPNLKLFAEEIKIPYTTLVTMLNKGINRSSVDNVIKVCKALGLNINALADEALKPDPLTTNFLSFSAENKKIPIIGSVKCGPDGLAFEYIDGYVFVDEFLSGDIMAFHCKGDSMKDIGITDGDIAIVRKQCTVENGELAIVVINGEEGTLKRVRYHDDILILEAANQEYPSRVFAGKEINIVKIVGKVLQVRKNF